MAAERTEAFSCGQTFVESSKLCGRNIFSISSNGHRAVVSIVTLEEATKLASLVRDQYFRSADVPVVWSPIDQDYWLLRAGHGIEHFTLGDPLKTGSDSDAVYIARGVFEEGVLLVQYMQPWKRTSHHHHEEEIEVYSGNDGLLIWKGEREVVPVETVTKIGPKESHIGFTLNKPAITCIFNFGREVKHIPLPQRPSLKFLVEQARKNGMVSDKAYAEFKMLEASALS